MNLFDIKPGNYHETEIFSHPRMGRTSILVNGKAFAGITHYGIQQLLETKSEFKPLKLTDEWLDAFDFEVSAWSKKKIPTILDGSTTYFVLSKIGDEYLVCIEEHATQHMTMMEVYENLKDMVDAGEDLENFNFLAKETTVNIGFVKYVHELQNLYHEITKQHLIYNSKIK